MSESSDNDERRIDLRVDKIHLVQVSRVDEEGFRADLSTGRTLNLSRGGMRLELYHALPLRSLVSLNLVLGEDIIDVTGIVVYLEALDADRSCMGIEFEPLDPQSQKLLEAYVDAAAT